MVKVSIIVPVYNSEKYIEKCLNSLINQTLKEIEIIIVNDGSTDNSLEIIRKFSDSRIKIIDKANGGQSSARNKGLETVCGEYIGFIDSDDWIDLDYYEKLYSAAVKYDADIAMADFIRTGSNKHKIRLNLTEEKLYTTVEDKIQVAHALKEGCTCNKIYRKELVANLRFPEGMFFEDGIFTIKTLFYSNKLVTVPGIYYYYYKNPKSTVNTMDAQKQADKEKSRREILAFFKSNNIKIKDKTYWAVLKKITIWKFNLFTIQESMQSKRILLFGLIPFINIR